MCSFTSGDRGWEIDNVQYRMNYLANGMFPGYSAVEESGSLIIKGIMMNDVRNGTEYCCFLMDINIRAINKSDEIFLYVAGEYYVDLMHIVMCTTCTTMYVSTKLDFTVIKAT